MPGALQLASISTRRAQITETAKKFRDQPIKTLSKYMDLAWLHEAYRLTRKDGAVGVDGTAAKEYAKDLEARLADLLDRLHSGDRYRAPTVRRVHIPKGDGSKTRPIGIPTFEDKVAQRAVAMLLEPVYEQDFYNFSFGFRPGRSAQEAVEFLGAGLYRMGGGWVLEVDIQSFFDTLDHKALREILSRRIADGVVLRLIGKWLRAGVLEGGVVSRSTQGTPQGGVISPWLANVFLHEVLDRWWVEEVRPCLRGKSLLVRYADDFVMAFSDEQDALRVQKVLAARFARFGLTLHPEKTRLVRFECPGEDSDGDDGQSWKPFDFLGFRYLWSRSRKGSWYVARKTSSGRLNRALRTLNAWLRAHRHKPIPWQAEKLGAKLRGFYNYFGTVGNIGALRSYRRGAERLWLKWLCRRSQRARLTWKKFTALLRRHPLPKARLVRRVTDRKQRQLVNA